MNIIYYFYNKQQDDDPITGKRLYPWYQVRILFQAIDIYDRFLCYYFEKAKSTASVPVSAPSSRCETGRPEVSPSPSLTKETSEFYFIICMYLAIKYFLTLLEPPSFSKLVDEKYATPDMMKLAEDYEWFILHDVLKFKIYRPTVYEMADRFDLKLDPQQTVNLLYVYADSPDTSEFLEDFFVKCSKRAMVELPNRIIKPSSQVESNKVKIEPPELKTVIPKVYVPTEDSIPSKAKLTEENQHINLGLQTTHGGKLSISQNMHYLHPEPIKIT